MLDKLKKYFYKKKDNRSPCQILKEDVVVFKEAGTNDLILYNKKTGNKVHIVCFS